jgi:hypothetical protein
VTGGAPSRRVYDDNYYSPALGVICDVAPGALADLLVVDGNPLHDIRVLTTPQRSLKLIMKNGRIYRNEFWAGR